jgi:hypothetical protein
MNKQTQRTIIITIIIILLLLAVVYFLFMYKFPGTVIPPVKKPVSEQSTTTNQSLPGSTTSPTGIPVKTNVPPASSAAITQDNLVKKAESFAARLGSCSNQSNFDNVSDLKIMMTASMRSWADKYIADNQKKPYSGVYQGVTTQAVTSKVLDFDDAKGKADILVGTQKVSVTGTSSPVTTNQDITITLVKQNGNWLVDNAVWAK